MRKLKGDVVVKISFAFAISWPSSCHSLAFLCMCTLSCSVVSDTATPWTGPQAPLSMEFSSLEYWGGLPFLSPGDLPNPRIELGSPALAGGFFTTEPPGKSGERNYGPVNWQVRNRNP